MIERPSGISRISAIVAITAQHVIGRKGQGMPWHYTDDMRRFARLTRGHTVVMGRYTFESINEKPLPKRRNIVISRRKTYEQVECFPSIESALAACQGEVWIIGGGEIYAQAMPLVDFIDVTYVPDELVGDDLVYFPTIDPAIWIASEPTQCTQDDRLTRRTFTRRPVSD